MGNVLQYIRKKAFGIRLQSYIKWLKIEVSYREGCIPTKSAIEVIDIEIRDTLFVSTAFRIDHHSNVIPCLVSTKRGTFFAFNTYVRTFSV